MDSNDLIELEEQHAKELAVLAHDIFKITYEHKLLGEFEQINFKKYLQNAFAHAQVMKEIQDPNSKYYGIFQEGVMIGYIKLNFLGNQSMERPQDHLEVERLYIKPEEQGNGLGKMMLNWVTDWAKKNGYQKLWLRSWERNDGGIAFYKKMGMKIVGTAEYKFEESDDVDFVLEMDLT